MLIRKINIALPLAVLLIVSAWPASAQTPQISIQQGHFGPVNSIAYSPDGNLLASASYDLTIKLWDVSTGTEIRTLKGHASPVTSVIFSPDGKLLASASNDYVIKLWDLETGALVRTISEGPRSIPRARDFDVQYSIAFSPDGKALAGGGTGHSVDIWDIATGTIVRRLIGHSDVVLAVAFCPDGTTLASGSNDGVIKLWNFTNGVQLNSITGHSSAVGSVVFSPDGKTLASCSSDHSVKLWNVSSGDASKVFDGHTSAVLKVAFSGDGQVLASAGLDFEVRVWNVSTGTLEHILNNTQPSLSVAFSPGEYDRDTLAVGNYNLNIKLWDYVTGQEIRTLKGHSAQINSIALSPDGKCIASAGWDNVIKIWDLKTGTLVRSLRGLKGMIWTVVFSPDGKTVAAGDENLIKIWNAASGEEINTIGLADGFTGGIAYSPDSKTIAIGGGGGKFVHLWSVPSGVLIRRLDAHNQVLFSIAFSPDGKSIATGGRNGMVRLSDLASGSERYSVNGHTGIVRSIVFSSDGKTFATTGEDKTIKLWDVSTGAITKEITGHSEAVFSISFSADGKTLASGSYDKTIKLWDVTTGAQKSILEGHSFSVSSVIFGLDDRLLISASWDMSIKVWDLRSGRVLATMSAVDDNDWIVVTPDGVFDGSSGAWDKIIWRFSNKLGDYAPIESYFNEFYFPGLLAVVFSGDLLKAPGKIEDKDRRQPQLELTTPDAKPDRSVSNRNLKIRISVSDALAGARDVRLFRNGSLVKVWHGDVLRGRPSAVFDTTIQVIAGENRLTAYAFNNDNVKSRDAKLNVNGADSLKKQGTLFMIAVGVDKYEASSSDAGGRNYDLQYAVADIDAVSREIEDRQAYLKKYSKTQVIKLVNADATKQNVMLALKRLGSVSAFPMPASVSQAAKAEFAKITPAGPEDAVLFYFSGHGTARCQSAPGAKTRNCDRFYLLPYDGFRGGVFPDESSRMESIYQHSISDDELDDVFEDIDAGKLLMVIDACNSGQALEAEEKRRGPMNSRGLAQLAYEKGIYILTASQSQQAALEVTSFGHGLLTYSLLEGLRNADKNPSGEIIERSWFNYASAEVPKLQRSAISIPEPAKTKPEGNRDIVPFRVNGPGRKASGAQQAAQSPRVFYSREADLTPFVVSRP